MSTTILYYSDNKIDRDIERLVHNNLRLMNNPIISVTQKPTALGTNICVGEIGSSWLNLYKQLKIAAETATTTYVAMAEHDCLYTQEHYDWVPPRNDTFYYNENCWFLQYKGGHPELEGMFSTFWGERKALSQLVCDRELLLADLTYKLRLLDEHEWVKTSLLFAGEPGVTRIKEAQKWAKSNNGISLHKFISSYLNKQKSDVFFTTNPNLDIRHDKNFTGPKRGKNRRFTLDGWGTLEDILA
jgi:hypothetical protein